MMKDTIYRQNALEVIQSMYPGMPRVPWMLKKWKKQYEPYIRVEEKIKDLPSAQPGSLTDKEKRIFLAAMAREEKVCKQVDAEYRDCREPYKDSLVSTCHEIRRKVKGALWT